MLSKETSGLWIFFKINLIFSYHLGFADSDLSYVIPIRSSRSLVLQISPSGSRAGIDEVMKSIIIIIIIIIIIAPWKW
jgi:hypothetical protein